LNRGIEEDRGGSWRRVTRFGGAIWFVSTHCSFPSLPFLLFLSCYFSCSLFRNELPKMILLISNFHFLDFARVFLQSLTDFRLSPAYRFHLSFPLPSPPYTLPSLLTAATTRANTSVPPHSSSP